MCGILAVIGAALPSEGSFAAALELIRHRGPDDQGVWRTRHACLGNRRLAIIDAGSGGHQPMVDPETHVALAFNGEIYNYVELRRLLEASGHRFRTRSDTEVLLRAYLEWGEACISRLNGMWAFVVWDPRNGRAYFARDRFGVKPFYYCLSDDSFALASEPKALLALFPQFRAVDEDALYELLADGRVQAGSHSFYAGIRVLRPGHCGTFAVGDSAPRLTRYWKLPEPQGDALDDGAVVERFAEVFEDAVRLRLRSDVPVGITLSGGLDSTAVLHGMQTALDHRGGPVTAFTSVYGGKKGEPVVDEAPWARRAVAPYSRARLQEVGVAQDDWIGTLRRIVWHMDGPGRSPAVIPLWNIMETARTSGVPVLLEGQGGDELLGGYGHHGAVALLQSLTAMTRSPTCSSVREAMRLTRSATSAFSLATLISELAVEAVPELKRMYLKQYGTLATLQPEFVQAFGGERRSPSDGEGDPSTSLLERRLRTDFCTDTLPGYLQYGDAISMAHSIETRLPFLDYRVVELCSRLPPRWKIGDGEAKRLLRHYLRRANHHAIAERKDKRGYPTPIDAWLGADGGRLARELLLGTDAHITPYIRRDRLARLIARHARGHVGTASHLYRLVASELWLRECVGPAAHHRG